MNHDIQLPFPQILALSISEADSIVDKMPFGASIFDSIFSLVSNYLGVPCDGINNRGDEAIDRLPEMHNVDSQPQSKRRKVQKSLPVNSKYVKKIAGWLADDEITTIGIYGMGGIGKTTLALQLHSRIQNHDIPSVDFHAIAWVSVEMDFTVYQLQQKIADAFGLDLQGDKDENRRAAILYAILSRNGKSILFLDNLWGDFRREDVGIPRQCRLILMSRSLNVCCDCQKILKVEPLSEEESWQLFLHSFAYDVSDPKRVLYVSKLVYDECAGLPLAITALANSVRGMVNTASRWKEAVEGLNTFSMTPTQLDDVFNRLKLSYEKLNIVEVQRCFLYAALYPKGYAINKEELIRLWIGERLIDGGASLQAQYDKGHSILNKLLSSCLLETCQDKRSIRMHDLVRRMALSIARDKFVVKPDVTSKLEFCVNLNVVSSSISLIPSGTACKCDNLTTLLLKHNPIELIPESFFLHMRVLRVLNLSATRITRLPSSSNALEELQVLDLSSCENLKEVPQLSKLHKVRFLDLSQTAVEQVPHSLRMSKGLRELDLSSILDPKKIPWGVLPALSYLKRLSCHVFGVIHELQDLKSLVSLDAKFDNLFDLSVYVKSEHWRTLECFHLQVGHQIRPKRSFSRGVSPHGCTLSGQRGEQFVLPYDIRELSLDESDILNPAISYGGFNQEAEAFSSLETCTIKRCNDVEQLLSLGWVPNFQCLEILEVEDCVQLEELIVEDVSLPQLKQLILISLPQLNSIFKAQLVCASLRSLTVVDCPNLKRLPFSYMDAVENNLVLVDWIEGQQKWWDLLEWDRPESEVMLKPFFRCKSSLDVCCSKE